MERRMAKNPPGCGIENEQPEPLPTLEEAKQSFEERKKKKLNPRRKRRKENEIEQKSTSNHTERQCKQRLRETPFI